MRQSLGGTRARGSRAEFSEIRTDGLLETREALRNQSLACCVSYIPVVATG